jgi:hypothetical protein
LTSGAKTLLLALIVAAITPNIRSAAESPKGPTVDTHDTAANPVAEVRNARSWEYGPFINWGKGVGDRSDFNFLWGGAQLGKTLTPVVHAGIFSGQFEYGGNIMPLWMAFTPAAHEQTFIYQGVVYTQPIGGGTFVGLSLTPVIFRWNFLTKSRRIQPWFQAAGGLIYTTHKFPPDVLVPERRDRHALFSSFPAFDRSRRKCCTHFFRLSG